MPGIDIHDELGKQFMPNYQQIVIT